MCIIMYVFYVSYCISQLFYYAFMPRIKDKNLVRPVTYNDSLRSDCRTVHGTRYGYGKHDCTTHR